ncbi:hypothetical protein CTAYLR_000644 [Chrysophaeum taylorii]|uniref:Anaphase-promoting complex subunit 13 n=1 Tax=Chrysophaeum taylorii TaxID=2483200 RepID=A0AAD7UAA2_9STRA|nr:hypothetical protein CTAYLR_000644 [Chrysophaeum taylorii]
MSDSQYPKLIAFKNVFEIVDDAWLEDSLSDDDIDLPQGEDLATDEGELETGDVLEASREDDRWTDLALEEVTGPAPLR